MIIKFHIKKFGARIFTILFCALAPNLHAQVNANASFSPETVESGDTFSLRILVRGGKTAPKGVDFSAWQGIFPLENILEQYGWERSGAQWVKHYTLIAFDSADMQLPPLRVLTHLGDSVPTNPLVLSVRPTPSPDELEAMKAVRDIRHADGINWADYWPFTLGLAVVLVFLIWRMRRKKAPPAPVAPIPAAPVAETPAHTVALQQLERLAAEQPWLKDQVHDYYTAIGLILRTYIEKAHSIPAPETTTRETVQLLQSAGFPPEWIKNIQRILLRADMVKYAHLGMENNLHEKTLEDSVRVIQFFHGGFNSDGRGMN